MRAKKRKKETFVLGDIHGNHKGLIQLLNKVNFKKNKDHLIFLGDLADGYPEPHKCLETFLSIKSFTPIIGNHDLFLKKWLFEEVIDKRWIKMGADETMFHFKKYKQQLNEYFNLATFFYIKYNCIFCHGGFNHKRPLTKQKKLTFAINRKLFKTAKVYEKQGIKFKIKENEFSKNNLNYIFIGHTPTNSGKPEFYSNLINLDTGSGNGGCLTIMNVTNFKYCQATKSKILYK